MFRKILIANRGEIACRIIRTARRMGVATVAVYSDADAGALHVAMADLAYRIGPAAPRESYLNTAAILEAVRVSGAEALHPGYGFLSENADFAEACAGAGVVFIGPPPSAIRAMGGKSQSKALMEQAGVPLVPGYHGVAQDEATLTEAAARIGYPVLIKASAGGGGKGMRVVESAADLPAALAGARREGLSSFGDARLLIERYLQRPRHIEIQIFADAHGNAVHLFERDCSIQRRHQKIIEEAPAPGMDPVLRAAMGEAAVAAARAVGYVGAGTVEFIVEGGAFHFMEMNTRLQVEHPVTEAITGTDLVEWQLRVAAGERLPKMQDALSIDGHAIEVRLYAEDPARNFLPSVGTLTHLELPATARIESGVRAGDAITPDYDPMIAKLIVHGPDRATALARLRIALAGCEVVGVQTNLALLGAIARHPAFASGAFDTGFIGRNPEVLSLDATPPTTAIAAAALHLLGQPAPAHAAEPHSPWSTTDAFRLNLQGEVTVHLAIDDGMLTIRSRPDGDAWHLSWDDIAHHARLSHGTLWLDGTTIPLTLVPGERLTVLTAGRPYAFTVIDPLAPPSAAPPGADHVLAPIPGRITAVLCAPGDTVAKGQPLIILEAMKMEMTLTAAMDGTIAAVRCAVGDMVQERADLVDFAAEA